MKDLTEMFARAMALPTHKYKKASKAHRNDENIVLVGTQIHAVTNATSKHPIIGAHVEDPCGLLVVNCYERQTAAVDHNPTINGNEFEMLIKLLNARKDEKMDVHVLGHPLSAEATHNEKVKAWLISLLEALESYPNAELKTFDVLGKPKPFAAVLDTRDPSRKLIRGTELYKEALTAQTREDFILDAFEAVDATKEDFDGRLPEHQL